MLEVDLIKKVSEWLQNHGYAVKTHLYISGKTYKEIDVLAQKKDMKIGVEVKTLNRDHGFFIGMEQCSQFLPYVNSMYMAMPFYAVREHHLKICKSMGIGLLSVGRNVIKLIEPEKGSIEKEIPTHGLIAPVYSTKEGELLYSLINLAKIADRQKIVRITSGEFGEIIGISQPTAFRRLLAMQKLRLIRKMGEGYRLNYRYKTTFLITEKGYRVLKTLRRELSEILERSI